MNKNRHIVGFIVALVLILLYMTAYTVHQGQRGLLLRLGKIIANPITGKAYAIKPGLHFKWPFINQVRRFDVRLQTLSVSSSRILTEEQKYVLVDYYAKWRIVNLPLYYTRTGGFASRTQTLLQQQINDALRAAFGKRSITEVVSGERINIMALLREAANRSAKNLGIEVIDVRIKRIDLPKEVSDSVFARMRAQREQVATQHRANGRAKAEAIRANADATATVMVATARASAAKVRALGINVAAHIYAQAYQKDPEFYAFYRSLQAYKHTFNQPKDLVILRPDSQFFNYFVSAKGTKKTS